MKDFYITDNDKKIDIKVWQDLRDYVAKNEGNNIVVSVSTFTTKRSQPQLSVYWLLMKQIQKPVNYAGNNYSREELSDMLKLRFFFKEVLGEKIPRSIANKSDCSKEEMREFLDNIINWSGEMGFKVEITSAELQSLINQYKE